MITAELRDYQEAAQAAIVAEWERVDGTAVVMPTGTGKTCLFASIADLMAREGKVLCVAHTRDLIFQTASKIRKWTTRRVGIEMGSYKAQSGAYAPEIVVGSVQTLVKDHRREKFDAGDFRCVIVDECHHAAKHCTTYQATLEHFRGAKVLGVTATPDRGDRQGIIGPTRWMQSLAYDYPMFHEDRSSAIGDGWLVPIRQQVVEVQGLDFARLKTASGDYTATSVAAEYTRDDMLSRTARPLVDIAGDRQCVVFNATIEHAEQMAATLNLDGMARRPAVCIHGKLESRTRHDLLTQYARGDAQYICVCNTLVEGWDDPPTAIVAINRPTKARSRYAQMVGRGTRPLPECLSGLTADERRRLIGASVKPEMLVLDFVGCVSDLQLCVSVADILADEADEASVVARAKALGAAGVDGIAALRQARAEERADKARHETSLALIREEIELRGWVATGGRWDLHDVDPFTRFRSGPPRRETTPVQTTGDARATDKQIKFLVALGWSPERASTLTKRRARCEIGRSLGAGIEPNWCRMREFTRWRATR